MILSTSINLVSSCRARDLGLGEADDSASEPCPCPGAAAAPFSDDDMLYSKQRGKNNQSQYKNNTF
jgi:hypothetical protein